MNWFAVFGTSRFGCYGAQVRNYLWNQPFISRFNEDGKKAKSKGNHIWNIDARKKPEGGWEFRPFHRKLAGQPPPVAYAGLRWQWSPRVWDPQASRSNLPVQFSSPGLPSWLAWDDKGTLSGVPPQDAQSCDVTVEARVSLCFCFFLFSAGALDSFVLFAYVSLLRMVGKSFLCRLFILMSRRCNRGPMLLLPRDQR